MSAIQFNASKGREVEFYNRVDTNDPTNSALIMTVIATGSADGLFGLRDFATFSAIFAGGYTEVTNTGYSRKTLTDADLSAYTVDNTNNWILLTLPLQTFSTISAGSNWDIVVVGYDNDTTGGTDANIVPITAAELRISGTAIVPAGGNVLIDFSSGWITAT
jgi:hypothetical protein